VNTQRRLEIALALAILVGLLAWTVITGKAPMPYDIELTLPEAQGAAPEHMVAKPGKGQPRNLEVERSLERLEISELEAEHGSVWWKADAGYTRLTNLNGVKDSDLVVCKAREGAPWTVWGTMYNRENNVGRYARDPGFTYQCPIITSSTNHEWHLTAREYWPVHKHSIQWTSGRSMHN
jgi:hypothetical protein